jgi:hypothetical protein
MGKTTSGGSTYTDENGNTVSVTPAGEVIGVTEEGHPTSSLLVSGSDSDLGENAAEGDPQPVDDDAPVDVDGDGQYTGYEVFTKADLIAECENRGLPVTGNKPDLVARLQEADKATAEQVEGGA